MRRVAAALCLALLVGTATRADEERELAAAASAYLAPDQEFLLQPRTAFLAALEALREREGVDALADIALLRRIVLQGRHFLPRFSDRSWQRANDVATFETDGPYRHVVSEHHRLSYALPRGYPDDRRLARIPHPDPFPLLLSIHGEQDTRDASGQTETFPGGAVLPRRYPRSGFDALYDGWLLLAPAAAHGRFLDADGAIRHPVLTSVLTSFWRRYHVDFDRVVVDGGVPATALAAAFPQVFAGVVLRPGAEVDPDVVVNWATLPVFVVDDGDLAAGLAAHGHPDVTLGTSAELAAWLAARHRRTARSFRWRYEGPDHAHAHWIQITDPDPAAPDHTLAVEAVDTEDAPNTIRIDARGIDRLDLYLNDEIVDLDRPVRLVVNGELRDLGLLERDFGRLFEKDPEVRRNMNFGWLYTVLVHDVPVHGSAPGEPAAVPAVPAEPAEPDAPPRVPSQRERLLAQQAWLEGRPDEIEEHLGPGPDAVTAELLLPFALRDLWWRSAEGVGLRVRVREALRATPEGALADQLRWILAGGGGDPYPRFRDPAGDPWPVLTALVLERRMRETTGAAWLPDESPVLRRKVLQAPQAWQDWYARWCAWFYGDVMRVAYAGEGPDDLPDAMRAEDEAQAALAAETRTRNAWLAVLAGLLFVGSVLAVGRRARRAGSTP